MRWQVGLVIGCAVIGGVGLGVFVARPAPPPQQAAPQLLTSTNRYLITVGPEPSARVVATVHPEADDPPARSLATPDRWVSLTRAALRAPAFSWRRLAADMGAWGLDSLAIQAPTIRDVAALGGLAPRLRRLELGYGGSYPALDSAEFPALEALALRASPSFSGRGLDADRMPRLRSLELEEIPIDRAFAEQLAALPTLQALTLREPRLSQDAFAGSGGCRALRSLVLEGVEQPWQRWLGPELIELELERTPIGAAALAQLEAQPRLGSLRLVAMRLTPATLRRAAARVGELAIVAAPEPLTAALLAAVPPGVRTLDLSRSPLAEGALAALAGREGLALRVDAARRAEAAAALPGVRLLAPSEPAAE